MGPEGIMLSEVSQRKKNIDMIQHVESKKQISNNNITTKVTDIESRLAVAREKGGWGSGQNR